MFFSIALLVARKWQKERWLNFVYLIGYIYILHFSWKGNSLPGHFFCPFLLFTSHKIQKKNQILGAEFCVASTKLQELYRPVNSVSHNCGKDTQAYSAAYTLWCFTSCTSFISDWVGHRKKKSTVPSCVWDFSYNMSGVGGGE